MSWEKLRDGERRVVDAVRIVFRELVSNRGHMQDLIAVRPVAGRFRRKL